MSFHRRKMPSISTSGLEELMERTYMDSDIDRSCQRRKFSGQSKASPHTAHI